MDAISIIEHKRDGGKLSAEEIQFAVEHFTRGEIPDYQFASLLMAIYLNGMDVEETAELTSAMTNSGEVVDLSGIDGIVADKHSTGGVGDKTSMILVPIVAACGGKVAKMSGRALGHSGGTIDKLESIPGFRTELGIEEFIAQVNSIGCAIIAASGDVAPADKVIYALRDVTATVGSIPLMAASIMSKKLASGSQAIVLDVKCGSGAFMKTPELAKELATRMIDTGKAKGKFMAAFITNMDVPLGSKIGNGLEVFEVVKTLMNEGPADLANEAIEISAVMLHLSKIGSLEECKLLAKAALEDGSALAKFKEMVIAQGGDVSYIDQPEKLFASARSIDVPAPSDCFIKHMLTDEIGILSNHLGAGRLKKTDSLDNAAGIEILKKTGDHIKEGEIIARLFSSDETKLTGKIEEYLRTLQFTTSESDIGANPLVFDFLT